MEKLLTPAEVAVILKVTRVTVYRMLREGRLPGIKLSRRRWLIPEANLLTLLGASSNGC